jgi:hypothetical protein
MAFELEMSLQFSDARTRLPKSSILKGLFLFIFIYKSYHPTPVRDSISRPVAPVSPEG